MDDHISNMDLDSLTLEQAKQEILNLMEFKKATFDFLHRLCRYEIREPVLSILFRRMTKEYLNKDITLDPTELLERAEFAGEDIKRIIQIVDTLAWNERNHRSIKSVLPSPQKTNLSQILSKSISQAKEKIDFDNKRLAQLLEAEKSGRVKVMQAREPIEFTSNISINLPPIYADTEFIQWILGDLTWLMTSHHLKTKIEFDTQFDHRFVHVTISCWSFDARDIDLEDYQRFDTASTFLMFSSSSLVLYYCWRVTKEYGGSMNYDIKKSSARGEEPDITFVTITLPRYDEMNRTQ